MCETTKVLYRKKYILTLSTETIIKIYYTGMKNEDKENDGNEENAREQAHIDLLECTDILCLRV